MRNERVVLSKAQILDRVWKYDFQGQSNIVELYIGYLRKQGRQRSSPSSSTPSAARGT